MEVGGRKRVHVCTRMGRALFAPFKVREVLSYHVTSCSLGYADAVRIWAIMSRAVNRDFVASDQLAHELE